MMSMMLCRGGSVACAAGVAGLKLKLNSGDAAECKPYQGKMSHVRTESFPLTSHDHGKAKIRVLKVRHSSTNGNGREKHSVSEYTVNTRLFSPEYAKVFTDDDNAGLIATDTQKNTVYVVAKRTEAATPEQFGLDIAAHFLKTYPILSACQIEVEETLWERAMVESACGSKESGHDHAFMKKSPERSCAVVRAARGSEPSVVSSIRGMVILKTTQSGFAGYHKDEYTLLPDCDDRCLATELSSDWSYSGNHVDFARARAAIRNQIIKGLFGPVEGGVFSASLQATIYDAACCALTAVPELARISLNTPNIHYLPTTGTLKALGVVDKSEQYVRDVFIPTSEPSGTIRCEVSRESMAK